MHGLSMVLPDVPRDLQYHRLKPDILFIDMKTFITVYGDGEVNPMVFIFIVINWVGSLMNMMPIQVLPGIHMRI